MVENKKILKNTLALYSRLFITMALGLVSSRFILNSLGVVDYGIYNVVGGIVTMFTFLNGSMAASVSRYLTYELGTGNQERLNAVFSTSMITHIILSIGIVLLSETIGMWFLYHKMIIPENRIDCAFWVFQISILSTVLNIISVPYNSLIVAHERMTTFALITVLDSILKFGVAISLPYLPGDRLLIYALCIMFILVLDRILYQIYCLSHYPESKVRFVFHKTIFREMFTFAGWSLSGNVAIMCINTGTNMLLNTFFGPIVNTARGIALQVNGALISFYTNFQMALMPQITKSYAKSKLNDMHEILCLGTRVSFFLLFILGLPAFVFSPQLLELWLGQTPQYSVTFLRVILITSMIGCMSRPLVISIHATGNIKKFQLWESGSLLLLLPTAYLFLYLGYSPVSVFIVQVFIELLAQVIRIYIVLPMIKCSLSYYLNHALKPIIKVASISLIICCMLYSFYDNSSSAYNVIILCGMMIATLLITITIGFSNSERKKVYTTIKKIRE